MEIFGGALVCWGFLWVSPYVASDPEKDEMFLRKQQQSYSSSSCVNCPCEII